MEHGWLDGAGRAAGVDEGRLRGVHAFMIQNMRSKVKREVCPRLSTVVLVLQCFGERERQFTIYPAVAGPPLRYGD